MPFALSPAVVSKTDACAHTSEHTDTCAVLSVSDCCRYIKNITTGTNIKISIYFWVAYFAVFFICKKSIIRCHFLKMVANV